MGINKIFNSLNVVSEGSSFNTIGFLVSKSGSTANPGITSFIVRDDSSTGVNTLLPTAMLTVSGDCRITTLPTGGDLMVTADLAGNLFTQPIPGFPEFGSGCTLTGITVVGPVITFHLVGTGCTATTFTATTGQALGPYEIGAGLNAIQPILPGTNFANAQFSNIQGGANNLIEAGSGWSNILGGISNRLINTSRWSSVGGGIDNRINNSAVSSILGGHHNLINISGVTNGYGLITAGYENTVLRRYGSVVNGALNTVEDDFSAIIGAQNTTTDRTYTTFMEGLDVDTNRQSPNPNSQAFKYHGVFANNGNPGDVLTSVDALGNAQWRPTGFPPFSGDCYVVSATTNSATCITTFYLSGPGCGSFTAQTCDGSYSPYRPTGTQSIVPTVPGGIAWNTNVIDVASNNSNVGGGVLNRILGGSTNSLIAGGRSNIIRNNSTWSNIGGGVANIIDDSQVSSIVGGHHNEINIPGFGIGYGLIGAGFQNTVENQYGSVINGRDNTVEDDFSAIIGAQNKTTDRQHTTFTEGLDVDSNRQNPNPDSQALRYFGTFASPATNRILTSVDALGNAVWMPPTNPPQDPDCPYVSAYTTNSGCILHLVNCSGDTFTADTCNTFGAISPYEFRAQQSISTVLPDTTVASVNYIVDNQFFSNIQGGDYNKINTWGGAQGGRNAIGGGVLNIIGGPVSGTSLGNVALSNIGGGYNNHLKGNDQSYMNIGGGRKNIIFDGGYGHIGGGNENIITASTRSFIGGGESNHIRNNSHNSSIVGGAVNYILSNVNSIIGGGSYNTIYSQHSIIGGGASHIIGASGFHTTTHAGIFAGSGNTIGRSAEYSAIVNGSGNVVNTRYSAIIGGQDLTTNRPHTTFTEGLDVDTNRGGTGNTQAFKYHGTFASPGLNRVLTDIDGLGNAVWKEHGIVIDPDCPIVSAYTSNSGCTLHLIDCSGNTITADTCSTFGAISPYRFGAFGAFNSIEPILSPLSANDIWTSVGGGILNQIWGMGTSAGARIGAGQINRINDSMVSYIGAGTANWISLAPNSVIVGGASNHLVNSAFSFIGGGISNRVGQVGGSGNQSNFIGGGVSNLILDANTVSSIVGGHFNIISNDSDYGFIGGGKNNRLGDVIPGGLWTHYSSILGGKSNEIAGDNSADYAAIVNGSGNTVSSHYAAIIGGRGLTADRTNTTFMEGLDVDTNLNGPNKPFRYHGAFASNGPVGHVLTTTNAAGDAQWRPGGVVWTYGCPIVSATSNNCILTLINCTGGTITADTCNSFGMLSPYELRGGLDSISTVLPGQTFANTNFIHNSLAFSNIQGGEYNSLNSDGQFNAILGGQYNFIGAAGGATIPGGPPPPPPQGNIYWSNIGGGSENQIRGYDVMGDTIAGGRRNVLTATTNSVISGGWTNRINGGWRHTIGGGAFNRIYPDAYPTSSNTIGGGDSNTIFDGSTNIIAGGDGNTITQWSIGKWSEDSFIGGGENNLVKGGHQSSIVGGEDNTVSNSALLLNHTHMFIGGGFGNTLHNSEYSSIVGGRDNIIDTSSRSSIVGGEDNTITTASDYAGILAGFQNTISINSNYGAIVNGSNNTVSDIYSAIIGGANLTTNRAYTTFMEGLDVDTNRGGAGNAQAFKYHGQFANHGNPGDVLTSVDALGNAKWLPIGFPPFSGDCYVVSATTNSATCITTFYLNGPGCGTFTAQTCDGSYSPYRPTGTQSIVPTVPGPIAFNTNVIDLGSNNSNVGGGTFNRITNNSDTSVIAGGRSNIIRNNSTWSNIGGGVVNLINDSRVSSIVGGHDNEINITGIGNGYGLITAGFQNSVIAEYGSVINGRDNTVGLGHAYSAIIGSRNRVTDRTYTTFTEGLDVDSNRADGALDGQAFRYYGTFASPGMRRVLTDVDGFGNAVWMDLPNPPQDPGCPFVSAFTTNSGCTLNLVNCTGGTFTADTCNSFGGVSPYTIGAGIDSIEPVMMIGSANAHNSNVQGGFNHNIHSTSRYSSIVGGNTNNINSASLASFIGNGSSNTITTSSSSSIVGGSNNVVTSKSDISSIVGGLTNMILGGSKSIIGAGELNMITGSTKSGISSGEQNLIFDSTNSHISTGKFNEIIENGYYNHIGAGTGNVIKGNSSYSSIAAGGSNLMTNSSSGNRTAYSFIGAGEHNKLSGASWSTIVSGINNKIIDTGDTPGAILTGQYNLIKDSEYTAIINGRNNTINGLSFDSSAIIGADNITVDRRNTTFMEGLDVNSNRQSPLPESQAFKYHGTFASPATNRILTSVDNLGNAQWRDGGPVTQDPDCPFVSAYTSNSGCTLNLIDCSGNTFTAETCTTFGSYSPYQIGATGAPQSIEPVLSPGSANGVYSSVGGGNGNNIAANGLGSRIGGGLWNFMVGVNTGGYIGAGWQNLLSGTSFTAIVGGNLNKAQKTTNSFIGGGYSNLIGSNSATINHYNVIVGGIQNTIQDDSQGSTIVGGQINSINTDSDYNFIGGGYHNRLGNTNNLLWTNYSSILGGKDNEIAGDGVADYAAIVNGSGNTVEQNYSAVIGGRGLRADRSHTTFMQGLDVDTDHDSVTRPFRYHGTFANNGNPGYVLTAMDTLGNASWQPVGISVSGDCYAVSASTNSATCVTTFYLSGPGCGTFTAQTCDGSYSPYRPTGDNSIVPTVPGPIALTTNVIDNTSTNSNVGGGTHNRITANSDTSVISGGRGNRIVIGSSWSNIGGGVTNLIDDSDVSSILGGHRNTVSTGGGNQGYGTVINGFQNTVNHQYSVVMGGANITTNRDYTVFMRGLDVNTTEQNPTGPAVESPFRYHGGFANNGNAGDILTSVDTSGNSQWRDSGIVYLGDEVVVSAQTSGCILTLTTNSGNTITANTCTTYSGPYKGGQGTDNIIPTSPATIFANYTDATTIWSNIQGGLLNKISGSTASTVVGGIGNRIENSTYSAIINGVGNVVSASTRSVIINGLYNIVTTGTTDSVIMGASGVKAYTDQTTYIDNQQAHGKVRLSSQEYNNTNSLNNSLAKMTLDVVHDTGTIRGMGNNEGGGEIVRFGDIGPGYGTGVLVQLQSAMWTAADANDTSNQGNMLGMALGSNPQNEGVLIRGFIKATAAHDGAWFDGDPLYVHTGTGQISNAVPNTSGAYVRNIGYCAMDETYVYFNPESTYIVVQ